MNQRVVHSYVKAVIKSFLHLLGMCRLGVAILILNFLFRALFASKCFKRNINYLRCSYLSLLFTGIASVHSIVFLKLHSLHLFLDGVHLGSVNKLKFYMNSLDYLDNIQ